MRSLTPFIVPDVIGGTNVLLYYHLDDYLILTDVYGHRDSIMRIDDESVRKVSETMQPLEVEAPFAETRMNSAAFSSAYTWIFPLLVHEELIGIVKIENLHLTVRPIYSQLPTFFNYAALVLKNEIQNYSRLRAAISELSEEVTARRKAEADLRGALKRHEDLNFIVNHSPVYVFRWRNEPGWPVEFVSDNIEQFLGYATDELLSGKVLFEQLIHPEDLVRVSKEVATFIAGGLPELLQEYRLVGKDGSIHWIEDKSWPEPDQSGAVRHVRGVLWSITERKQMELEREQYRHQLLEVQKLEAVGQLAAGIAHEINTPIQFVKTNARFLQDSLPGLLRLIELGNQLCGEGGSGANATAIKAEFRQIAEEADVDYLTAEIPKAIEESLGGINRVADIVRSMRSFSHPDAPEKESCDINARIHDAITLTRNEWKYVAEMETDLDPEIPTIRCYPGSINQVLLNLIVNAAQAIAEAKEVDPARAGVIRIATAKR